MCFWFIAKTNLSWYSFLLCDVVVVIVAAAAFFPTLFQYLFLVQHPQFGKWQMPKERAPCDAKINFFSDASMDYWINDVTRFRNQWTFNAIILHLILFSTMRKDWKINRKCLDEISKNCLVYEINFIVFLDIFIRFF